MFVILPIYQYQYNVHIQQYLHITKTTIQTLPISGATYFTLAVLFLSFFRVPNIPSLLNFLSFSSETNRKMILPSGLPWKSHSSEILVLKIHFFYQVNHVR